MPYYLHPIAFVLMIDMVVWCETYSAIHLCTLCIVCLGTNTHKYTQHEIRSLTMCFCFSVHHDNQFVAFVNAISIGCDTNIRFRTFRIWIKLCDFAFFSCMWYFPWIFIAYNIFCGVVVVFILFRLLSCEYVVGILGRVIDCIASWLLRYGDSISQPLRSYRLNQWWSFR